MSDTLAASYWGVTLEGPSNYLRWLRDFRGMAQVHGVWDLINGTETLLEKPTMSDVDDTQERKHAARNLAISSVSPFMRRNLLQFNAPHDMFNYLERQFKRSDYWQREAVRNRMDSIEFSHEKTMLNFIEEIIQCQRDMNESGGTMTDEDVIHKIKCCLPDEYDTFVQGNIILVDESPELGKIRKGLLFIESHMLDNTPKKKRRPKCAGCGRWGHIHDYCRDSNP